jgi:predicted nucleic acid-binding protein
MADPFVDTDVLIRLLTRDDHQKQARAAAFFKRIEAGEMAVTAPITTIADAVYVLASPRLYNVPRPEVAALLSTLVRLRNFKIKNRQTVLRALDLYGTTNLDFGDALIVVSMKQAGTQVVYSYDEDFDRVKGITRREP